MAPVAPRIITTRHGTVVIPDGTGAWFSRHYQFDSKDPTLYQFQIASQNTYETAIGCACGSTGPKCIPVTDADPIADLFMRTSPDQIAALNDSQFAALVQLVPQALDAQSSQVGQIASTATDFSNALVTRYSNGTGISISLGSAAAAALSVSTGQDQRAVFTQLGIPVSDDLFQQYLDSLNPAAPPLVGPPAPPPPTPVAGPPAPLNCSVAFTGTNNVVGLSNGDPRFLCLDNRWYDCGWESNDPSWETKISEGQQIGSYVCSLSTSQWVLPAAYSAPMVPPTMTTPAPNQALAATNVVALGWAWEPWAVGYYVRVMDLDDPTASQSAAIDGDPAYDNWGCGIDVCTGVYTWNYFHVLVQPGHHYYYWVHAINAQGVYGDPVAGYFNVLPPSDPCASYGGYQDMNACFAASSTGCYFSDVTGNGLMCWRPQ
jgi:hypothetical protein